MNIRIEISSLATKQFSGVGNYTKLLTEALSKKEGLYTEGVYFNFLNRQPRPNVNIANIRQNNHFPLRVYAKIQSFSIAPPFDIQMPKTDVVIFPNFATWPTVNSRHTATVVHDLTYLHYPEVMESKNLAHLKRVVKRTMRDADTIITVSESVKQEIVNTFQVPSKKLLVTPIPPDDKYYSPRGNNVHATYSIPTRKYIYFVGNLEPRKDIPTLVRAYELLPKKVRAEYSLVLGGGRGWKTESSEAAIREAQERGENVIHVGYVHPEDAADMFHNADLFVMTSVYEGFGMPLLEAMAAKCPVVCSDIPVLRETAGTAALYAETGRAEAFAKHILSIISSTQLAEKIRKAGEKQLLKYSWSDNAERLVRHFEATLK